MTRVLVIGGGVAGAAVTYWAAHLGARVTLLDAAEGRASEVPAALVNPVRGQNGTVGARAVEGMRETWRLVEALEGLGYAIPHGRGLSRPVPDAATRERWATRLPPDLPHNWVDTAPGLAPGWSGALFLPEGGWLDGGALVRALTAASGAEVVRGRARAWDACGADLENGRLTADLVVFCGGSRGADWAGEAATHRGGSLWLTEGAPAPIPLSYGAYASPAATGGVIGATFEAPSAHFNATPPPSLSLDWLAGKARKLLGEVPPVTGTWSGSRLSGLRCGRTPDGVWRLTGLGSKGFLLGPLLARHLVGDALRARRATGLD